MSGQLINFKKYSIQFRHKIGEPIRQELQDILEVQNIDRMGSYLGIPYSLGGSKTQFFCFIQDRLKKIVSGWTFKWSQRRERM